ncbi:MULTISPECIES: hypothetical protein [unclassified Paraburkholderia]|uniref:hypothetical protein n=1 Tax=unclassified Paraburkholderia TaxID=2615204 RepID=UPI002AB27407|nr:MULTISPECIES: hypothetical protein [unclassified Paraburkholderia]
MKFLKLAVLATAVLCGAAHASTLTTADNSGQQLAHLKVQQCDSASFATGGAKNRQACRREFAREARPTVQTAPQSASDYAS